MNLVDFAQLLSAVAACLTVILAFIELSSRSKLKRADVAMDMYADFLNITQRLNYIQNGVSAFVSNYHHLTKEERLAYAKSHLPDEELYSLIQKFERDCVSSFEAKKDGSKKDGSYIIEHSGIASNVLLMVKTIYQHELDGGIYTEEKLSDRLGRVNKYFEELNCHESVILALLFKNVKKCHNTSNIYLITLICSAIIFLLVCMLLA